MAIALDLMQNYTIGYSKLYLLPPMLYHAAPLVIPPSKPSSGEQPVLPAIWSLPLLYAVASCRKIASSGEPKHQSCETKLSQKLPVAIIHNVRMPQLKGDTKF